MSTVPSSVEVDVCALQEEVDAVDAAPPTTIQEEIQTARTKAAPGKSVVVTHSPSALSPAFSWFGLIFFLSLAVFSLCQGHSLLIDYAKIDSVRHQQQLEKTLGVTLQRRGRPGALRPERLASVRSSILPLFQALPKNAEARLSSPVMRYLAHRYFSHKHAWTIKGFEKHDTSLGDTHILWNRAPGYSKVLEEDLANSGFTLEDAAILIAAVEQLIFDEIISDVESAYQINDKLPHVPTSKRSLREIVYSYLIETMLQGDFKNKAQHHQDKRNINAIYPNWQALVHFVKDIVESDAVERNQAASPLTRGASKMQHQYAFEETAHIATRVVEEFGPWSNYECKTMKDMLDGMDQFKTGRIPLAKFYKPSEGDTWQFSESPEYLRSFGAIDETSSKLGPQVIIPNYVYSMANCVLSTANYRVCCMNACEDILRHFEAYFQAPTGRPSKILEVAASFLDSNPAVHSPLRGFNESAKLRSRLVEIGEHHANSIPLHGRLFAQWLHFAFPQECPYPYEPGSVVQQTPKDFEEVLGVGMSTVNPKAELEIINHARARKHASSSSPSNDEEADLGMWSFAEYLLPASTRSDEQLCTRVVRSFAVFSMAASFAMMVFKKLLRNCHFLPSASKTAEPTPFVFVSGE